MQIGILGISHKSGELSLREPIARVCQHLFAQETELAERFGCALLSTCNRTEIYFSAEDVPLAHSEILHALREEISFPFEHTLYSYFGEDCFAHLAAVASGLDSALIAESEIQGQVRGAYQSAALLRTLPSCIHFLFQKSLKISKETRSLLSFDARETCLEKIIFSLVSSMFPASSPSILFVGNSEINRKIHFFFERKKHANLALCTRAPHAAKEWMQNVFSWEHLPLWHSYECVILGTRHPDYLITPEQIPTSLKTRLLIDLSVPRSVDPRAGKHPQITLMNIEELGRLAEKKQKRHEQEVAHLRAFIRYTVRNHMLSFHAKQFGVTCSSV